MRYKVKVRHVMTQTAEIDIDDVMNEDEAEDEAKRRAESDVKKIENQQTMPWEVDEDFVEVDEIEEIEGEEVTDEDGVGDPEEDLDEEDERP